MSDERIEIMIDTNGADRVLRELLSMLLSKGLLKELDMYTLDTYSAKD